ncbi:MAG: hypothetical protein EP349_09145 [Alphaproteobacteria bacterium]|nr:MAG: hypothetical protein EP349_09145 [Alphaproteobacteria bacterium]
MAHDMTPKEILLKATEAAFEFEKYALLEDKDVEAATEPLLVIAHILDDYRNTVDQNTPLSFTDAVKDEKNNIKWTELANQLGKVMEAASAKADPKNKKPFNPTQYPKF